VLVILWARKRETRYIGAKFNTEDNFGMQWGFQNLRTNIIFGLDAMVDVKYGTNAILSGKVGKMGNKVGLAAVLGTNIISDSYGSSYKMYGGAEFLYNATENTMLSIGYTSKGIAIGISKAMF
jgi:hypothetical protein